MLFIVWDFAMNYSDLWKRYVRLSEAEVPTTATPVINPSTTATPVAPATTVDPAKQAEDQKKKVEAQKSLADLQVAIKNIQDQANKLQASLSEVKGKRAKVTKKSGGDRCTRIAKRKYDVWPSAYASGAVVKCRQGKIWKGISENATDEQIDMALLLEDVQIIDEEWSEKYKRSINCKNPKGFSQKAHCQGRKKKVNEIAAYHGSSVDFDQFEAEKAREFGFHFGTIESAMHRNSSNVKKYDVSITKPIELDDVGFWEPASILKNMAINNYISEDEKQTLLQQINMEAIRRAKASGSSLRYEKNEILKSKLEEMGYDGIVYENRGEAGDTAYIAFRPEQVKFIEKLDEAKKKAYKPNFSKEKEQGLHGWFARNDGKGWVNCRTGGPCGRDNADSGGKYPACRPTKAQCKSAGRGPLRKKKSSEAISWTKKNKKNKKD